jgi:putative endonuclease
MAPAAFVYLLLCRDGSLYCGWTTDPRGREAAHDRGRGAAYTRARRPVKLVYVESCADRSAALKREYAIKQLTRAEKLALVRAGKGLARLPRGAPEKTPAKPRPARRKPPPR